jgi:hypothetical protein
VQVGRLGTIRLNNRVYLDSIRKLCEWIPFYGLSVVAALGDSGDCCIDKRN